MGVIENSCEVCKGNGRLWVPVYGRVRQSRAVNCTSCDGSGQKCDRKLDPRLDRFRHAK